MKTLSGYAGCGALLREADGNWIRGYCRFLGDVSILRAEAWAMLEGLRIAASCGVQLLIVESDSLLLVKAVLKLAAFPIEIQGLVGAISNSDAGFQCWKVRHVWPEANMCADMLAGLGADRCDSGDVMVFSEPPIGLGQLLLGDVLGIGIDREVAV